MDKLKKILTILSNTINSQELSDALAASDFSAHEWTDEGLKDVEDQVNKLMTVEAAKNNKELMDVFKKDESFIKSLIEDNPSQIREIKAGILESVATDWRAYARSHGLDVADDLKYAEVSKLIMEADLSKVDPKAKENIDKLASQREGLRTFSWPGCS